VRRAAIVKRSQVMSNDQVDAIAYPARRVPGVSRIRAIAFGGALLLGLGGLAACGDDDDDASDSVTGQTALGGDTSEPGATDRPSTTRASSTTAAATSTSARASTTAAAAGATTTAADGTAATGSAPADATDAASTSAATSTTARAAPQASAGATESTPPAGSEPAGTSTEPSGPTTSAGPTTTGPECEFTENDEFPLVRCDAGPAVAALQSVLQTLEYEIGTVDCLFGDQTLYAVRAFQADEELTVSGEVDAETWAALEATFLPGWGDDDNGNGTIEPNEITLVCG
jgi:peptidoglycan hydrolase-like protein with peptidoglycan-binding domain